MTCVNISSKHWHSQTIKARELTFWENVHFPPSVTFYASNVTYYVSHVMCICIFFLQSWRASWWRVLYQQGLPRPTFSRLTYVIWSISGGVSHSYRTIIDTQKCRKPRGRNIGANPDNIKKNCSGTTKMLPI